MCIKAFLFDLDGTLVDSEIMWVYAVRDYLVDKGIDFDYASAVELVYGNPWEYIYEEIAKKYPFLEDEIPNLIERIYPYFNKYTREMELAIPGSIELLKRLSKNYPCAIVSGSYRKDVENMVESLGIGKYLEFFLGKEDYFPGKPHPAGYLKAAEILGVEPKECVAFEDSTVGFKAVKSAGMYCVALVREGRPLQDLSLVDLALPDLSLFTVDMLKEKKESKLAVEKTYQEEK